MRLQMEHPPWEELLLLEGGREKVRSALNLARFPAIGLKSHLKRLLVSIFSGVPAAFVPGAPAGLLHRCVWDRVRLGWQQPGNDLGWGGQPPHLISPLHGAPCALCKGFSVVWEQVVHRCWVCSKRNLSMAHHAGDTCSDMGHCTAALLGARFALHVFWAREILLFPLKVLFLECLFQMLKNTDRQLLATV